MCVCSRKVACLMFGPGNARKLSQSGMIFETMNIADFCYNTGSVNRADAFDRNITQAEFTRLLTGALGLAKETPEEPTFEDVKPVNWYYECVETATKAGLIKGYKGKFRPNDFITRQEITAIMIRATGKESEALAKTQEKIDLADEAQISAWARGYVALAVESGLIEGYPDKTFGPKKNTTRAEAAVIICRLKKY
ncbi:MAG: hypothetical protein STSR0004_18550 [Peptococcaceae bacterium]